MSIPFESSDSTVPPFDSIAEEYDDIFSNSSIGRAQRASVWMETDRTFRPGERILEINCGTGIDALHMAGRGLEVLACDSAPAMIAVARARLDRSPVRRSLTLRCLPIEHIDRLERDRPYDGIFSNFAGLNCVEDLSRVARDLAYLIKPGGKAILCMFGHVCLWEIAWYLARGKPRKAFRRLRRDGVVANVSGNSSVVVRYHTVASLERVFRPYFRLECWKGVGVAVPPSYLEAVAIRFPRLFQLAADIDRWIGRCWVLRGLADHMVLTFERRNGEP
jgi:ubiquinone/menaquinone biosynthesis C-methylase UbiE